MQTDEGELDWTTVASKLTIQDQRGEDATTGGGCIDNCKTCSSTFPHGENLIHLRWRNEAGGVQRKVRVWAGGGRVVQGAGARGGSVVAEGRLLASRSVSSI